MSKHTDSLMADCQKLVALTEKITEASDGLRDLIVQIPRSREGALALTKLDELDYWAGRAMREILEPILGELQEAGLVKITEA
ncbi:hypothetical protein CcrC1_gp081 [Caulobacter phage C1]|nr:hypothetical protein CcrC1_gp081 [Caulobacter phage C1]UTU08309.1 hypothetical protein CcrC2_gp081 [Caulobacter phage C2]UTU08830.1 hypothetical protein CcrJ4_gp079 [Caulobacter phage J4]UTU09383.1 hypothetical protein CcrBL47_gp097 [Caulobacter phage BL47]UTU09943.1 hypothetical protein CcrRB23_gp081 [Caulobacter phage RB23]WGN96968.1 hypothetical protein [Bertelyvirus sp.]